MRNDLLGRFNRLALSVLITIAPTGGPVMVQTFARGDETADPSQQLRQLADNIDQYAKLMKPIASAVDRTRFQTPAVVEQVGKDPQALAKWVREQTRWVPYQGCLRGPGGVLMDRMGNSLDRSLLLVKLLQEAGLPARLAHGKPDAAAQMKLSQAKLAQAAPTTQPASPPAGADEDQLIQQIASAGGMSVDQVKDAIQKQDLQSQKDREQLVGTVTEQSKRLEQTLASVMQSADRATQPAPASEAEHWWAQYNTSNGWVDADPQTADGKAVCAASETVEVPQDWLAPLKSRKLLHELTLRIKVEQSGADGQHEQVAMEKTLPAAEFTGKAITLTVLPLHWPGDLDLTGPDAPQKIKDTLKAQTEWVPLLMIDGQQWYQDGFDDHGTIEKHPSLDSLGQVGGSVAKAGNAVLDVFGGLGNDSPTPAKDTSILTGVWIEYQIQTPGVPAPQVIRRDIYDYYGPARRAAGLSKSMPSLDEMARMKRSAALYQGINILPTGCILSQDYVTAQSISDLERMAPILSGALRQAAGGAMEPALKALSSAQPMPVLLMGMASLREGPQGVGADHLVVDRLNVFTLRQGLAMHDDGNCSAWRAIDIVANATGDESLAGQSQSSAFAQSVQQGVLDTYVEKMMVAAPVTENVAAMYQASAASGAQPWVLLKKGDDPSKLKLSPDAQARIAADLSSGYVVVAPRDPVTVNQRACEGWWRIDPTTGSTLGIGASGMGPAAAEYATLMKIIAVESGFLAFAGCGGISAMQSGSGVKALGCAVCGVLAGVLVYFGGMGSLGATGTLAKGAAGFPGWAGGTLLAGGCNAWSAAKQ